MAARIPTAADLGFNDPHAVSGDLRYPANDPVATGLGTLGQGLQQAGAATLHIANEQEDKRQALNEATATTDFVNKLVPLHTAISQETDPEKIADLRSQYDGMLQNSSSAIDNPQRKALWLARHSSALVHAQADADTRLSTLNTANYFTDIERQLDGLIENASKSSDPKVFDIAKLAGGQLIDAAGQHGGISPQALYQKRKQFEHALDTSGSHARINAGAMRALGMAPQGSAGGGDVGAGPPITVPEEYKGLVSGAAQTYGVPQGLLARVLHAESGFDPNAVSPTGARGIAQFIGSTAQERGVNPGDPKSAIPGAASYLADLRARTGSWEGALRGYLGSDPNKDASYKKSGAIQTALALDRGESPAASSQLAPEGGGNLVAFGDSIAAHLVRKAGVGGQESGKVGVFNEGDTAVSGYSPEKVLDVISRSSDENIQGKNVVLSTGASNNPAQLDLIPQQIDALKARGAASVTLMGVGAAGKLAGVNDKLQQLATDSGATFSGPLRKVAGDGIHSSDPRAELAAVQAAMTSAQAAPTGLDASGGDVAGATGGPQRNRSGLPSLQQITDHIMSDPGYRNLDEKMAAVRVAQARYTGMEADAARAERLKAQQQRQMNDDAENRVIADKYSSNPQITAADVSQMPALTPESKMRMMNYLKQDNADVDPALAKQTERELVADIVAGKITDTGPIFDAFIGKKLREQEFHFAKQQLQDFRTPEGEKILKLIDQTVKTLEPQIDHSNPLMGRVDYDGKTQIGLFAADLREMVDDARKAGKSATEIKEMLNPRRFLNDQSLLAPYLKTMQESQKTLRDRIKTVTGQPPVQPARVANPLVSAPVATAPIPPAGTTTMAPNPFVAPVAAPPTPAAPPTAPGIVSRNPGESLSDYVKRTGAGAMR